MLKQIANDIFTGPDNKTVEVAHVLWALGVILLMAIAAYVTIKTGTYPTNFGQDFMFIMSGGAVGSFARAKADQTLDTPNKSDDNTED